MAVVFYICYCEPFSSKLVTFMQILNEAFTLIQIYCQMCFTDLVVDIDAKVTMGNVQINIIILNVAINLCVLLYGILSKQIKAIQLRC